MKEQRFDRAPLISSHFIKKEHSLFCYVPLLYSATLLFFTAALMIITLIQSSIVPFSELPLQKPSLFQLGVFLSSLPGFVMVWSYHLLIWSKLQDQKNAYFWVGGSFFAGICTQMALVLFGITGSEGEIVSESVIKIQENVFLTGFMLSSVVYESFTMTLTLQAQSKQVITHGESWVNWKIAIFVVVLLVSFMQLSILMYLNMYKAKILMKSIWVVINYLAFFLHLAYSSTFYWDLKQISFTINFSQKDSEENSLNSSTF